MKEGNEEKSYYLDSPWNDLKRESLTQPINKKYLLQDREIILEEIAFHIQRTIISVRGSFKKGKHFITAHIMDEKDRYSGLLGVSGVRDDENLRLLEFAPIHPDVDKVEIILKQWNTVEIEKARELPLSERVVILSDHTGPSTMTSKIGFEADFDFPDDVILKMSRLFGENFIHPVPSPEPTKHLLKITVDVDRDKWKKYSYEIPINREFRLGAIDFNFEKVMGWKSAVQLLYSANFPPSLKGEAEKKWQSSWDKILEVIKESDTCDEILEKAEDICSYHPAQEGPTNISFRISNQNPDEKNLVNSTYHSISPYSERISFPFMLNLLIEYAQNIPIVKPVQYFINPGTDKIELDMELEIVKTKFKGKIIIHNLEILPDYINMVHQADFPELDGMEISPVFEVIDNRMCRYFLISRSLPIDFEGKNAEKTQLIKSIYNKSPIPHLLLDKIKSRPNQIILLVNRVNIHFNQPHVWSLL
ncbi:MAG: hypothetical protein K8T10_14735 [Candidatus Eremiobacteraeota bacterium]|nr:hypothetical protein [Candidatus Eremiobacteraeota bacterium]